MYYTGNNPCILIPIALVLIPILSIEVYNNDVLYYITEYYHVLWWIIYYTSVTTHQQKVVVSHWIRTKDHSIVWHMCLTTRPCSSVLYATCRGYIVHILGWQRYFSWAVLEQQWIMQYNHVHCNTVLSNKKILYYTQCWRYYVCIIVNNTLYICDNTPTKSGGFNKKLWFLTGFEPRTIALYDTCV